MNVDFLWGAGHQILSLVKILFLLFTNSCSGSGPNRPWIRIRHGGKYPGYWQSCFFFLIFEIHYVRHSLQGKVPHHFLGAQFEGTPFDTRFTRSQEMRRPLCRPSKYNPIRYGLESLPSKQASAAQYTPLLPKQVSSVFLVYRGKGSRNPMGGPGLVNVLA